VIVLGLAQSACENTPGCSDYDVGFFEIAKVGIPTTAIGILYMFVFSRFFLPGITSNTCALSQWRDGEWFWLINQNARVVHAVNTSPTEELMNQPREYTAAVVVRTVCQLYYARYRGQSAYRLPLLGL
jgi:hypothetical protein